MKKLMFMIMAVFLFSCKEENNEVVLLENDTVKNEKDSIAVSPLLSIGSGVPVWAEKDTIKIYKQ